MTLPDMSTRSAIDRALLNDRDALEEVLFLRYEWLQEVASKTIPTSFRTKVAIDDVLEESFVRAFREFSAFSPLNGEAGLFQWLKLIVQNSAGEALRRASQAQVSPVQVNPAVQENSVVQVNPAGQTNPVGRVNPAPKQQSSPLS